MFFQLITASLLEVIHPFKNACWLLNTRLSRKCRFTVSHIDILWQSCMNQLWNVLWARNQPRVPDPYSRSLVCATWTIPRASTQISLPQSYESKVLTSPFSLIAHFFPGLAIILLTLSLPAGYLQCGTHGL